MQVLLYGSVPVNRIDLLKKHLTTPWDIDPLPDTTDRDIARKHAAEADAMVGIAFEPDLTAAAAKLKMYHVTGAALNFFNMTDLPKGSVLCNVFEHEAPIAEYVMLNVLLHTSEQNHYAQTMREGKWDGSGRHDGAFHEEVMGKTIGLVGFGHIGEQVAKRAKAFGMRVNAVRRSPVDHADLDWCGPTADLHRLLEEADFLVIACPHTPETENLLGEAELQKLKPTAVLINPSRGPIINEKALYKALNEKWFAAAALDAHYEYPDHVDDIQRGWTEPFHELSNVILTPHFSAWTAQMVSRRWAKIAANLDNLYHGHPLDRVVFDQR